MRKMLLDQIENPTLPDERKKQVEKHLILLEEKSFQRALQVIDL
jgi:hypothetical protein